MRKLKLVTVVGTRPEIIKLSRVIAALDRHVDHVLVHSGQNFDYELNEVFFQQLEIRKPDYFLGVAGGSVAESIGQIIVKSDEVFAKEKPDALLLYGDTNTCLSVIPAKRRRIPVFHMEAGNRCFDARVPEELNRKVVDHLSDINMPLTEHARRYLLDEGLKPETVIKIGSAMKEVLRYYRPGIEASKILDELGLAPGKYFVVSAHREENVDREAHLRALLEMMGRLVADYQLPVVVSTHPRTRKRLDALGVDISHSGDKIRYLKPFGFLDYIKLQMNAACVLSDSGTLTEEASLLGFPAVMIRQAHERPEGQDSGVVIMAGLNLERILQSIRIAMGQGGGRRPVPDYEVEDVADKVVRIVTGYVDYVNRTVWYRDSP